MSASELAARTESRGFVRRLFCARPYRKRGGELRAFRENGSLRKADMPDLCTVKCGKRRREDEARFRRERPPVLAGDQAPGGSDAVRRRRSAARSRRRPPPWRRRKRRRRLRRRGGAGPRGGKNSSSAIREHKDCRSIYSMPMLLSEPFRRFAGAAAGKNRKKWK